MRDLIAGLLSLVVSISIVVIPEWLLWHFLLPGDVYWHRLAALILMMTAFAFLIVLAVMAFMFCFAILS